MGFAIVGIVRLLGGADEFFQRLAIVLKPLVQDEEVSTDAEIFNAHIQIFLGIFGLTDLGAGAYPLLNACLDYVLFHFHDLWNVALTRLANIHTIIGPTPLHHIHARNVENFL